MKNQHSLLPGVFIAQKKSGETYFRSTITFQKKHISLGSFSKEQDAHEAYCTASSLLHEDPRQTPEDYIPQALSFSKWVVLTNFKNNGIYIKTPIYLRNNYFQYYLSQTDILVFDVDDLFYYSNHSIMRRGSHLFVSDYGMQVNIASRYGIKNFAVPGRDFRFVNGDDHDFRYENIQIMSSYHGVIKTSDSYPATFTAKIHVNGDWILGKYGTQEEAAIAYNKAADLLIQAGGNIHYTKNYLQELSSKEYHRLYEEVPLSERFLNYIHG